MTLDSECGGVNGMNEAIEFAMRTSSTSADPWIPVRLNYYSRGRNNTRDKNVRGYTVQAIHTEDALQHVSICGSASLLENATEIQFRWMGTVMTKRGRDIWALSDVSATLFNDETRFEILEGSFGK